MHRARSFTSSLFLTAALALPLCVVAASMPQDRDNRDNRDQNDAKNRVYDRNHKDYHNWDNNENHAWGQYLEQNHKKTHEFSKANKKEQSQYWNWRHDHPDDKR